MVIVDTSIWIDLLRGASNPHTTWIEQNIHHQRLALTDLILCELLQGLDSEPMSLQVQRDMQDFTIFQTGGDALAIASARNYRFLRTRGYTIRKTIDCLIATFCIMEGHSLLHRDRDFDVFEQHLGLNVVRP